MDSAVSTTPLKLRQSNIQSFFKKATPTEAKNGREREHNNRPMKRTRDEDGDGGDVENVGDGGEGGLVRTPLEKKARVKEEEEKEEQVGQEGAQGEEFEVEKVLDYSWCRATVSMVY